MNLRSILILAVLSASLQAQTVNYTQHIKPIFDKYECTACHGGSGGLHVSPYAQLFSTGNHKPVVVANDTNSILILKVKGIAGFGSRMPAGGDPISDADLRTLVQWVKNGAPLNATAVVEQEDRLTLRSFDLAQNYPNPFNPSTRIRFAVPQQGQVALTLHDVTGRNVMTVVNRVMDAGQYSVTLHADELAGGVYFYRLTAAGRTTVKKLMLVK
ncbi:MAG: T9SS type A sorting domain-containing protein [Bacteroidetes bacterium]|nr:T9SS type A sorting domain-containing protein [Bacteroidota bacterium]